MNELHIYEDMDRFEEIFGDLDFTMLHSGKKHLVFVYGTLMVGMRNHFRMETEGVRLITKNAATDGYFKMLSRRTSGGYLAPIVVPWEYAKVRSQIAGEVYEVSNEMLITLDRLEGHPVVYRRETKRIGYTLQDTHWASEDMWMYVYAEEISPNYNQTDGVETVRSDGQLMYTWVGA
jgi:gamma-glutamylcyclotransferase (GGCT)/AIG2-like uncharacterized protein YtfP